MPVTSHAVLPVGLLAAGSCNAVIFFGGKHSFQGKNVSVIIIDDQ